MKTIFIFLLLLISYFLIKEPNMNFKQSLLKKLYPIIMLKGKWFPSANDLQVNALGKNPIASFYELTAIANNGDTIYFKDFIGKKVLLVNTASDCGYTGQYEELEALHRQEKDLVVIGFPANDFKEQEKLSDDRIASFCKINYGVSFLLMQKSVVIKGKDQHPVYQWLSQANLNGWCNQAPSWNFSKYLISEKGVLLQFASQNMSPRKAFTMDISRGN